MINKFARLNFGLERNIDKNHSITLLYKLLFEYRVNIYVDNEESIKEVLNCFLKIMNKIDVNIIEKRNGFILFSNRNQIKYKSRMR